MQWTAESDRRSAVMVEHNIESGRTAKQLLAPESGAEPWRLFHAV